MGSIELQDGETIRDVKRVVDTHDGFVGVELRDGRTLVFISKERIKTIDGLKWG